MTRSLFVLVVSALVLTSCATVRDSRLNPFNWFGRATSEPVSAEAGAANPLIPQRRASILRRDDGAAIYLGAPVAQVTELALERRLGGAILRTEGLAARVGPFDVRLVPVPEASGGGALTFTLSAVQQAGPRSVGPRARLVTAGLWLTDQQLAGVRSITVRGAQNALTTRR